MKTKTFKTLDEQIDILISKGLVFDDIDNAKSILLRENYFFLSGYRHVFLNPDNKTFIEGTKFRELYAMFSFDRQLRNIIFKNILIVENNLKSIAFCCISTGEFRFPNDKAAEIAVKTVREYKAQTSSTMEVIFNVFKELDYNIYREILQAD